MGATVFAWKGETLAEYWWCTEQMMTVPGRDGCDQLVDDGGDATMLIHKGREYEATYAKTKQLPDSASTSNAEFKCVLQLIRDSIPRDPTKWTRMAAYCKGVSEETTTGVHCLKEMAAKGELLFPAINVNDCVTKSKFDNVYGCRHSLPDGIMRATDVMIGGKRALICGFGDVGKGSCQAMKGAGARVIVSECDPICALQACMEGYQVTTMEKVVGEIDIFVSTTGNFNIITLEHMKKMKNNAIVGNIGHFDNEIDMAGLESFKGIKVENIKAQVDRYIFPDGMASSCWRLAVCSIWAAPLATSPSSCRARSRTRPSRRSSSGRSATAGRTRLTRSTSSRRISTRRSPASTSQRSARSLPCSRRSRPITSTCLWVAPTSRTPTAIRRRA